MRLADEACEGAAKDALDPGQCETLLAQIPGWRIVQREGIAQLERTFTFRNFREALAFTVQVGELAEAADHHPAITTEWGRVTVCWWTHSVRGLHRNDFILAARTDSLL